MTAVVSHKRGGAGAKADGYMQVGMSWSVP
jgi:hypothetical protein